MSGVWETGGYDSSLDFWSHFFGSVLGMTGRQVTVLCPTSPPYPTIAGIIATHKIKHENRALRDSHVLEDADRFRCCYTKRTRMKKGANNGIFKETNYKYILNQLHSATSGPASSFR